MEEVVITRAQVQEKIKELVAIDTNPDSVKNKVSDWLKTTGCPDFDMKQILNDLQNYEEYRLLI